MRYSEDIDFVQKRPEAIGSTINRIRDLLKPWLGDPKWKITERSAKLIYQYQAIGNIPAKLKIEINTTEHFQVLPLKYVHFTVDSEWFSGECDIITYELDELIATKLRALYQRRKGRDLFDLWYVLKQNLIDVPNVINIFKKYCDKDGIIISKELFKKNMELKKLHHDFRMDMNILLPNQVKWDFDEAFDVVHKQLIDKIT